MDSFFRSLFGYPRQHHGQLGPDPNELPSFRNEHPMDINDDDDEEDGTNSHSGSTFFFGIPPPFFDGQHPFGDHHIDEDTDKPNQDEFDVPGGDPFRSFRQIGQGTEPRDMFRHFDEMFRSFDEVFRGMGTADFSGFSQHSPPVEEAPSLRDRMLKDSDPKQHHQGSAPAQPEFRAPNFMDKMWDFPNWARKPGANERLDKDLDEELQRGDLGLDSILAANQDPDAPPRPPPPCMELQPDSPTHLPPRSRFKTISVRTIRGADGRIEERRAMVDDCGNETTTVTRTLGDQTHTQTTTRNHRGEEEVAENFSNMDERDKESFDQHWSSPNVGNDNHFGESRSFLRNLFRLGFPGFVNAYKTT